MEKKDGIHNRENILMCCVVTTRRIGDKILGDEERIKNDLNRLFVT